MIYDINEIMLKIKMTENEHVSILKTNKKIFISTLLFYQEH